MVFSRLFHVILTNFQQPKKSDQSGRPFVDWAPSFAEIEHVITGDPIQICVYFPTGDQFKYEVN